MVDVKVSFTVTTSPYDSTTVSPVRLAASVPGSHDEVRYTDFTTLVNELLADTKRIPEITFGDLRHGLVLISGYSLAMARLSWPRHETITYTDGRQVRVNKRRWMWVLTIDALQGSWRLCRERGSVHAFELKGGRGVPVSPAHTVVWRAPTIGNIYGNGAVCWGDVWPELQKLKVQPPWPDIFDTVERLYWDSAFNGDLAGRHNNWHSSVTVADLIRSCLW